MWTLTPPAAGCPRIRRSLAAAVLAACAVLPGVPARTAADAPRAPHVAVAERSGVYTVTARFEVGRSPATALAVLTDYEGIPRFMPDVRKSLVLERTGHTAVVEQEAVSRLMMFSRRVHLVLEIAETPGALTFRDRCGRSFRTYSGAWRVDRSATGSTITYELVAQPAFDVPEFLLKRLLRRDAGEMIERLQTEIAAQPHR
ncbi:MAG TPA: SRPBCC family protein [Vicinamibacterales bacterium]|nr:SRPBCC family protein [Vicinamibacterales bacterium]